MMSELEDFSASFLPTASSRDVQVAYDIAALSSSSRKVNVLFVCTGNICRSPTAEAIFSKLVSEETEGGEGRKGRVNIGRIDSCGLGGGSGDWYREDGYAYHEGDLADRRMRDAALHRGVKLLSRSRPFRKKDLDKFDLIAVMDEGNVRDAMEAATYWREEEKAKKKIVRLWKFHSINFHGKLDTGKKGRRVEKIPDPYYGDKKGFEDVLDLLEDACEGLLKALTASPSRKGEKEGQERER